MKRKVIPVLIGLLLIVLILAGAAGVFLFQRYSGSKEEADLNAYFGLNGSQEVAIVWNQELTEEKGLLQDERCYLKLDTVHEMLNERFYVDHNEKLLLYTLPEETVQIGIGEQTADGYTAAVEQNGDVWLALDYVKQYSDFNYALYTEPNRVVLTTNWDTLQSAELKKNTALRVRGGVKSEVLQNLEKGTKVTVLEEMENWDQVQTQDGYIGYVQKKHLTDPAEETPVKDTGYVEPDYTGNLRDHKIDLAWHQVTVESANSTCPGVMSGVTGVNVISPTWFYLNDNNGNLANLASLDYVNYCHSQGVEVWALVSNLENKDADSAEVLTHTSKRQNLVNQIVSMAIQYNLDGINLDFESLNQSKVGDAYIEFVRELSIKCANNGIVLSIDNYVPTSYTAFYNRAEQANFADYVVIMGYDEHYAGGDAGSVSSIGWVKQGVADTLAEVPADQVILGMPFYTRVWQLTKNTSSKDSTDSEDNNDTKDNDNTSDSDYDVSSKIYGMRAADALLADNGVTKTWDKESGQNYAEFASGDSTFKVWLEDASSTEERLKVMQDNKLAGASFWKLGFETSDVWNTIIKYTN